MTEHQLIGIQSRPEIGKAHDHWHEIGCSCGWSAKYPSAYRARFMHEQHVNRESKPERKP